MAATRFRALLLANAVFEQDAGLVPLRGPLNDVKLLSDALTSPELGLFDKANVAVHVNGTHTEMCDLMEAFFLQAGPDDQLLFYYSGHGLRDNLNKLYLCARNTMTEKKSSSTLPASLIKDAMGNSPARRFVFLLDCCFSGAFKGGDIPDALRGTGIYVISSCRSSELSDDAGKDGDASVFTRFLVDSLCSVGADADADGFITVSEVYNHMLPRIRGIAKHTPQRWYDNAVGDLPLVRARARTVEPSAGAVPQPPEPEPPILDLAETEVKLDDVALGEDLPAEMIDVVNRGGGALDWVAETQDDWIALTQGNGFFQMKLAPRKIGVNRGIIYVRDRGRGGSKKVRVTVQVREPAARPLEVEPARLDFGEVRLGARSEMHTLATRGAGAGLTAACDHPAVRAEVKGDAVRVTIKPQALGRIEATLIISDDRSTVRVPVTASVEPGPILAIGEWRWHQRRNDHPAALDFGDVRRGETPARRIRITNAGTGELTWDWAKDGIFFEAAPAEDGLEVRLLEASEGAYHGAIRISSNGGDASMDVRAQIVPRAVPGLPQAVPGLPQVVPGLPQVAPGIINWAGNWRIDVNGFGLVSQILITMQPTGLLAGQLATMGYQVPIQGRWAFDAGLQQLGLELHGPGMSDLVVIQLVGEQGGVLHGHNGRGFTYALVRLP